MMRSGSIFLITAIGPTFQDAGRPIATGLRTAIPESASSRVPIGSGLPGRQVSPSRIDGRSL